MCGYQLSHSTSKASGGDGVNPARESLVQEPVRERPGHDERS